MDFEESIFKRSIVDFKKLEQYGFIKKDNLYYYSKNIMNDSFRVDIIIDKKGKLTGKIIDIEFNEEYNNFRIEINNGAFVNEIRNIYKELLMNIKDNCFNTKDFISSQANRVNNYIKEKYKDTPEFLWKKFNGYGVFRNKNNSKWYAIIMNVDKSKVDSNSSGETEIINLKLDRLKIQELLKTNGFYKSYHMNSNDWISIILDETLKDDIIFKLIDESYDIINDNEYWIVPANVKYYNISDCFELDDEIIWKQSSNIEVNDIVYVYAGTPYSSILYKCIAVEVNIPYEYRDKNIKMNKVMRIKLIKKYNPDKYTFTYLKTLGIRAIRGPIRINKSISNKLK